MKIAVLLSIGWDRRSGRPRRARADLNALRCAMAAQAADVRGYHAGMEDSDILRQYLATGLQQLVWLRSDRDPALVLLDALSAWAPDVILAGTRAEQGEATGFTPYFLAERLGLPVVAKSSDVTFTDTGITCTMRRPGGARRHIQTQSPIVIACVPQDGPPAQLRTAAQAMSHLQVVHDQTSTPAGKTAAWAGATRRKVPPPPLANRMAEHLGKSSSAAASSGILDYLNDPAGAAERLLHELEAAKLTTAPERDARTSTQGGTSRSA